MGRINLVIAALLMLAAISLVTSQYQARQLFIDSDRAQSQTHDLETDWRRLQLDRAEYANSVRVDQAATELHMTPILPDHTIYLNQQQVENGSDH